jgi:hypothetical protein
MNKKLWIAFPVIFIVWNVLNFVVHTLLLGGDYQSEEMMKLWRPDMMQKMWIFYLNTFIQSFFFVLIFSKWYKGKGITEGIQYGVYTGFLMTIGMAYSTYAMFPIPYIIAEKWFIFGMLHFIILGVVTALVFGKGQSEVS